MDDKDPRLVAKSEEARIKQLVQLSDDCEKYAALGNLEKTSPKTKEDEGYSGRAEVAAKKHVIQQTNAQQHNQEHAHRWELKPAC